MHHTAVAATVPGYSNLRPHPRVRDAVAMDAGPIAAIDVIQPERSRWSVKMCSGSGSITYRR